MTDLLTATRSFRTVFVSVRGGKSFSRHTRIFDSWWRAECISMSVYTVQQVCDPSHITGRADQWNKKWPCSPICLSGAHLGGSLWPWDTHTIPEKCTNPDVWGMKETFSTSLFLPLLLFACFHRPVDVIWVCEWYFILTVWQTESFWLCENQNGVLR